MTVDWLTAAQIAGLPGLPATESAVIRLIKRRAWQVPERQWSEDNPKGTWRRRQGRGGGVEYHLSLLPPEAQTKLALSEPPEAVAELPRPRTKTGAVRPEAVAESWRWYETLPDKAKTKARHRLAALSAVLVLTHNGQTKDAAVPLVASQRGVATSSIWGWFARVQGFDRVDWLPQLADRYAGRTKEADITPEAWEAFKADYLRLEQPSAESCHERLERIASARGWVLPSPKTLLRKIEREIAPAVRVLAREGADALKRMYPAQERDRSMFHALEAINGDGHKFDVFVRWPDGEIGRPMMVGFQDLYSGKILSWRVDKSENRDVIRLALGDVIEDHGIPYGIWFDNTRAFANKALTAGTASRFRFKIKDEDPVGLCVLLGIEVHFTLPYSGQSKPIERAWRDLCDYVARHPAFAGAWCGNNPMAKPENYGSKAVDLDDFLRVLAAEIEAHNARPGRRSRVCGGVKSFDQVYSESYAQAAIRRATPEQRRLWLLAAEGVRASDRDGSIKLMGNRYWDAALQDHRGQPLVVRFDPQDLTADVHVYRLDGGYVGAAVCIEAAGFKDANAARVHGRARRTWIKAQRVKLEAERRMDAAQYAALLPAAAESVALESKVTVPVFGRPNLGAVGHGRPVPVAKPLTESEAALLAAMEAEMEAPAAPAVVALDTVEARLRRLLDIRSREDAGAAITEDELAWVARQSRLPDIRARLQMIDDFGAEAVLTA